MSSDSSSTQVRIAVVGAGTVVRTRHLPGFASIPGVSILGICNQKRESSAKVARDYGIPKIYRSWEQAIDDDDIDAVVIGTWPYLHCPITLAALDAGKHVLTQPPMAMNSREAQRMYDRSLELPHLTTMLAPTHYGLTGDHYFRSLIDAGYLGTLREVHAQGLTSELADPKAPLGWSQMTKYCGFNTLALGSLYETVLRWVPEANRVVAYASKIVSKRIDPETNEPARIGTSDSVQVLTSQGDGSMGSYRLSGVVHHGGGLRVELYGSRGTLVYDLTRDEIHGAKRNEARLEVLPIPDTLRGSWRVEAEFIASILGEGTVRRNPFAVGVRCMQFTEAVARSSRHQHAVTLPLKEFSNPGL